MIAVLLLSAASAIALRLAHLTTSRSVARARFVIAPHAQPDRTRSWLDGALDRAAVPVSKPTVARAWAFSGAAAVIVATVIGGAALAVLTSVAAVGGPPLALWVSRGRGDRELEASLPDAIDAIARSLRSGGSLHGAVDEAASASSGPLRRDLERVVGEIAAGGSIIEALERWAVERPSSGVRLTTAALVLGAETGGASAQAIDGVAETLRTNLAVAGEVRALSSQARLSAIVIAVAPIGFAVLAATADRRNATFLLRTRAGVACLCAGLALDLAGGLWMRRLTSIDA